MPLAIFSYSTPRYTAGPRPSAPPIKTLGYFHGCPAPALPPCRVPMPVLRVVAARCCVSPPFLPLARWFVVPPARFVFPPVLVFRR